VSVAVHPTRHRSAVRGRAHVQKWGLLYFAVAGMIWTYVWRVQQVFPALSRIVMPISLLAIAAYAVRKDAIPRLKRLRHPIFRYAVLTLGWMILSVPDGVYPGYAARFIYQDHIKTVILFVLIAASIRTMKDVEKYALAHVAGALMFGGMSLWINAIDRSGRLSGIGYYDPNDLCMTMVCMLPIALYFVIRKKGLASRLLGFAALGVFAVVIIRTGSRGGFLGLLALGAYLLFQFRALKPSVRWAVVAVASIAFVTFASDEYWEQMRTLLNPQADYNWAGKSDTGRMEVWKRGLGYMFQNPIVGVGASSFFAAEGASELAQERALMGRGMKWSVSHNAYVQIGAELGIPGLAFLLLLLFHAFDGPRRIARTRRGTDEAAFGDVLSASVLGFAVTSTFLSSAYSPLLYANLGVALGFLRVMAAQQGDLMGGASSGVRRPRHSPRRRVGAHPIPQGVGRWALPGNTS
jgi:putative inorganic carbon (hco3(-)) transporter